jgi:hypothetical protein
VTLLKATLMGLMAAAMVIASVFVAAAVGVAGLVIVLLRRLLGRPAPRPWVPPGPVRRPGNSGDVIDVTATEVPPPPRGP